jgi:hypothetical protein
MKQTFWTFQGSEIALLNYFFYRESYSVIQHNLLMGVRMGDNIPIMCCEVYTTSITARLPLGGPDVYGHVIE